MTGQTLSAILTVRLVFPNVCDEEDADTWPGGFEALVRHLISEEGLWACVEDGAIIIAVEKVGQEEP